MIFNKEAIKEMHLRNKKRRWERLGIVCLIGLFFYFGSPALAGLVGLCSVIYILSEIDANLGYANFLKEQEMGIHDRLND